MDACLVTTQHDFGGEVKQHIVFIYKLLVPRNETVDATREVWEGAKRRIERNISSTARRTEEDEVKLRDVIEDTVLQGLKRKILLGAILNIDGFDHVTHVAQIRGNAVRTLAVKQQERAFASAYLSAKLPTGASTVAMRNKRTCGVAKRKVAGFEILNRCVG